MARKVAERGLGPSTVFDIAVDSAMDPAATDPRTSPAAIRSPRANLKSKS
jgi:hypothetical protein